MEQMMQVLKDRIARIISICFHAVKKGGILPIVVSALIAWVCALAQGYLKNNGLGTPGIVEIAYGFVLWLAVYCILLCFLNTLDSFAVDIFQKHSEDRDKCELNASDETSSFYSLLNRKTLRRSMIIILCWVPIILALFPGVPFHDTIFQLSQYFGNPAEGNFSTQVGASFTDHHPIFTTFVFGSVVKLGMTLSSSSTIGLFLLTVVQIAFTAYTFAFSCEYLEYIGVKKQLIRWVMISYAVFPLISLSVNCLVKETFFSWIFVWYFIFILEYIRTSGVFFRDKRTIILFVTACLLLALTKKTGLYLVVISNLALLVLYRKAVLVWLVSFILPTLIIVFILPLVVFPLFNISPGSPVEILGVLYQQTARYTLDYPNDVTIEEREIIDELIGYATISDRYQPRNIDSIKGYGFLDGVEYWPTSEQIVRYLKCYYSQGIKHPDAYLRAFCSVNACWFAFDSYGDIDNSIFGWTSKSANEASTWPDGVPHYFRPTFVDYLTEGLARLNILLSKTPIISLLYTPALYILFIPLMSFLLIAKAHKRYLGIFVPILVSLLFLLVSPVTGVSYEAYRYIIPFIYLTPVLIGFSTNIYVIKEDMRNDRSIKTAS
jgi:hypothetical protein